MITLATQLTLLRIVLIIPIILTIIQQAYITAGILTTIAILTDYLDGMLARRTNTLTTLGSFLDHLADKLLIHTILIYFVAYHGLSPTAYALLLARDFIVLGVRHLAAHQQVEISSMSLGKLKFVGQSILVLLLIAAQILPILSTAADILLWLTVLISILSAAQLLIHAKNVIT